jgi:hypothetical protein
MRGRPPRRGFLISECVEKLNLARLKSTDAMSHEVSEVVGER